MAYNANSQIKESHEFVIGFLIFIAVLGALFFLPFGLYSWASKREVGAGSFNGRVVDVGYEGWIFKSCEVDFQFGEQSSRVSSGSSWSKSLCDDLKQNLGKVVTIPYSTRMVTPFTLETKYVLGEEFRLGPDQGDKR